MIQSGGKTAPVRNEACFEERNSAFCRNRVLLGNAHIGTSADLDCPFMETAVITTHQGSATA